MRFNLVKYYYSFEGVSAGFRSLLQRHHGLKLELSLLLRSTLVVIAAMGDSRPTQFNHVFLNLSEHRLSIIPRRNQPRP